MPHQEMFAVTEEKKKKTFNSDTNRITEEQKGKVNINM